MRIGTSYYPEGLGDDEWAKDLRAMRDAGLTVLRIAEFAWSAMEPREGVYDFAWLDRFLNLAHEHRLEVVLCTPTATPPAWMTTQYPEMMVEMRDGRRNGPGGRRDADVENEVYRYFSAQIAQAMGRRYGDHPAVVGWQIDNELLGPEGIAPECHSAAATFRFRQHLKAIHGDVATLNTRWGTRFWSQDYSDWGEVPTPRHPRSTMGQVLDYSRYFSDSQKRFLILQRDALRAVVSPRQWISHNSTAVFDRGLDHADWAEALDICGWDAYFGAAGGYRPAASAALAHDLFRSAKQLPFWAFETNAVDARTTPAYWAEMRARGAEAVIVWHWRGHRANAEAGSNTICDHAGRPYDEKIQWLKAIASRPELAVPLPERFEPRRAAILFCPDCVRTSLTPDPYIQRGLEKKIGYLKVLVETYHLARAAGIALDVVRPGQPLDGYDLLLMPGAMFLSESATADIRRFVERGGALLGVAKTAHQDKWATRYPVPGAPLAETLGFAMRREVQSSSPMKIQMSDGQIVECEAHLERIEDAPAATIRGTFLDGPAAGQPAVLSHRFGKGSVEYVAGLAPKAIDAAIRRAAESAKIPIHEPVADGAILYPALDGDGAWALNHSDQAVKIDGVTIKPGDFGKLKAKR